MSALVMALCRIEQKICLENQLSLLSEADFRQKASFFSRLASGSACRSVYPSWTVWGKTSEAAESSDEYAVPLSLPIHSDFHSLHDTILIVSTEEKDVSSRAGHGLMNGNPFAEARYRQANENLGRLLKAMQSADWNTFIEIIENEALTLHALMMASYPSFVLLKPNSLALIEKIRAFRKETNITVGFTIDAGPNIHLIYPQFVQKEIQSWIENDLRNFCENNYYINDRILSNEN
jgi:diphosphomevalonate decarboxylase